MASYSVINPTVQEVPILISVPHCGTAFPSELKDQYKSHLASAPDDTDWFVDRLYDFASAMGMTMITANYSRWVIDLNRDPQSKPLYSDGRIITGLCPATNFLGESIYQDERKEVATTEVTRRVKEYYEPYHNKLEELLVSLKQKFGKVLLWDCHSIRQLVPTIHKEKFPDLILGDADETSSSSTYINMTLENFSSAKYSWSHNYPFKGGYITRHYGKPAEDQHALQLEMSKVNYMDSGELHYDIEKADTVRNLLMKNFTDLIQKLNA